MKAFVALPLLAALLGAGDWQSMFDGKSTQGWRETEFKGHGQVSVDNGTIVLNPGAPMTGITWTGRCNPCGHIGRSVQAWTSLTSPISPFQIHSQS